MQRVAPAGLLLDPAHLLYLATLRRRRSARPGRGDRRFRAGKSADFVYLRPPAGSPLATVLESQDDPTRVLAAIFTLAGAESVREVRIGGAVVYRAAAEER